MQTCRRTSCGSVRKFADRFFKALAKCLSDAANAAMKHLLVICASVMLATSCAEAERTPASASIEALPDMRWSHVEGHGAWNAAAIEALGDHGQPLVEIVPKDIETWCPAYPDAGPSERKAFWVGLMSAMAKHESTYKQTAVNPNGKWFGLLQIAPATARGYDCRAGSGAELKVGGENLSCAIRIMSVTVPRDGVIADKDSRWRGVAADWGPLRVPSKRRDISGWLKDQPFCQKS